MKKDFQTYKGYGINLVNNQYRAEAYANPTFYSNNLAKLKKAINQYLRGENYTNVHEYYNIK